MEIEEKNFIAFLDVLFSKRNKQSFNNNSV